MRVPLTPSEACADTCLLMCAEYLRAENRDVVIGYGRVTSEMYSVMGHNS